MEKSNLESSQAIVYIGTIFLLNVGLVKPTEERIQKLQKAVWSILRGQKSSNRFFAPSRYNCVLHRNHTKSTVVHEANTVTHFSFLETKFSKFREKNSYHKSFKNASKLVVKQKQSVKRKVNSSKTGPGHCDNRCIKNRVWRSHALQSSPRRMVRETKKLAHKSFRDGGSVLTVKHFLRSLQGQTVLIRIDNTTVVQYVNKQGGTKSPQLCYKTWDLWNLAIEHNILLKAAHVAGKVNILADKLSRYKILPSEWMLNINS